MWTDRDVHQIEIEIRRFVVLNSDRLASFLRFGRGEPSLYILFWLQISEDDYSLGVIAALRTAIDVCGIACVDVVGKASRPGFGLLSC